MKCIYIREILNFLEQYEPRASYSGSMDARVFGFSSLKGYKSGTLTWIRDEHNLSENMDVDYDLAVIEEGLNVIDRNCIITPNARRVFFAILDKFWGEDKKEEFIGRGTVIDDDVVLGKNVIIGSGCVIRGEVSIGDNTVIGNNVTIINNVTIGKNCNIQSSTVIGENGFSHLVSDNKERMMLRDYGGVSIGDNVHIGACTTIARGSLDSTVIGNGCKIDNLCHIAQNVIMDDNVVLVAGTLLYGSVHLGENSYVASGIVRNQVDIGSDAFVGMGALVVKDVEKGDSVKGFPASSFEPKKKE